MKACRILHAFGLLPSCGSFWVFDSDEPLASRLGRRKKQMPYILDLIQLTSGLGRMVCNFDGLPNLSSR